MTCSPPPSGVRCWRRTEAAARRAARLLLAVALAAPPAVRAHAFLEAASPAAGSRLAAPPTHLRLRYDSLIEAALSAVELTGDGGQAVPLGPIEPAADGTALEVTLPALAPGRYRVHWQVVARDGHVTEGSYRFHVDSAAAGPP